MPDADPPAGPAGPSLSSRRVVVAEVSGGKPGPARALGGEAGRQESPRWAADGKHLVYVHLDSAGGTASLRLGAEREPERTIVPQLSPPPSTGAGANGYLPWSDVLDYWAGPPGRDARVVH